MPFGGLCLPFAGVDLGAAVGPSALGQLAPMAVVPGCLAVARMQPFVMVGQATALSRYRRVSITSAHSSISNAPSPNCSAIAAAAAAVAASDQ